MFISFEYKVFFEEFFELIGLIKIKSMFGVDGVFVLLFDGDLMFGFVVGEMFYLKVDDINWYSFEEEGMRLFVFELKVGK